MDDRIDPDGDLARTLRMRFGEELRAEAEDAESDARNVALRSRTMGHVAHECMTQGRHVAMALFAHTVTGPIVHACGDLAVVAIGGRLAHVQLPVAVGLRVLASRSPGRSVIPGSPSSFLAALRTLEMSGPDVEVLAPLSIPARGALAAVTPDHVMLEVGEERVHIPLSWVGAVLTHEPGRTTGKGSPNLPWLGVS